MRPHTINEIYNVRYGEKVYCVSEIEISRYNQEANLAPDGRPTATLVSAWETEIF